MTTVSTGNDRPVQQIKAVSGYAPTPALKSLLWMAERNMPILASQMTSGIRMEAENFLRLKAMMHKKASPNRILTWCNVLREYVQDGPSTDEDMAAYAKILFEVCQDIPALFWTSATALAWVRHDPIGNRVAPGRFWPRPAEVYALLSERKNSLSWSIMHVDRLMKRIKRQAQEANAPARRIPTDEEKAAVKAALRGFLDSLPPSDGE